jgi:transcriptional regulator with XRE-family HTH domain
MNIKKTLGEKIKRVRKQRGLTQEKLAELIDIAPRNLSKIEVGACFVTAETLEKLLVALDISTEELFANDHIKEPDELLADINSKLKSIKSDQQKLETIYKMIEFILKG